MVISQKYFHNLSVQLLIISNSNHTFSTGMVLCFDQHKLYHSLNCNWSSCLESFCVGKLYLD